MHKIIEIKSAKDIWKLTNLWNIQSLYVNENIYSEIINLINNENIKYDDIKSSYKPKISIFISTWVSNNEIIIDEN